MKFVCDRCKTRYSIGDDRVRGKILKIRCKTCSNVITVREGMPSLDGADGDPGEASTAAAGAAGAGAPRRAHKSTTLAPAVQSESAAPPAAPGRGALGAAFASAMARSPAALEDEWYLSIEGEQAGPYGLAEAQRWVSERPPEAELFCWREGFDDWLPVDKVSQFRGLRKPAAGPRPPGVPRAQTSDPAPRPLFAATMAQLEQDAAPSELRGLGARAAAQSGPVMVGSGGPGAARGAPAALGARGAFDASDSATQLEPGLFEADAAATVPRMSALDRGAPAPGALGGSAAGPTGGGNGLGGLADPAGLTGDAGAGDDLDIAEVSRVVKLADLARDASRAPQVEPVPQPVLGAPRNATGPIRALGAGARNPTGALPRLEVPRVGELAPSPLANGTGHAAVLLPAPEPPPPSSNRRALVALIAGAVVLVGVAVGVVFFVLSDRGERGGGSRLGQVDQIDTTRPEEVRPVGGSDGSGSAVAITDPPTGSGATRPPRRIGLPPTGSGSATGAEGPEAGARLEAREIEEMASKNSSITQRCYMRAQRGAEGILIGDVKKIAVTLTISADGQITDAQLSDNHAQDSLGKCLLGAIRTWKFRPSPGGTFRFVLHFG